MEPKAHLFGARAHVLRDLLPEVLAEKIPSHDQLLILHLARGGAALDPRLEVHAEMPTVTCYVRHGVHLGREGDAALYHAHHHSDFIALVNQHEVTVHGEQGDRSYDQNGDLRKDAGLLLENVLRLR